MQANCLIFPSPKRFDVDKIKDKIILIPRQTQLNCHITYQSHCNTDSFPIQDQFSIQIDKMTMKNTTKTNFTSRAISDNLNQSKQIEIGSSLQVNPNQFIPCLFLKGMKNKLIVFFHANGQDIASAYDFLFLLNHQTNFPILAMEYPGYSIYQGNTTPQNIQKDANRIMQFLISQKIKNQDIIILGRSIGCAVGLSIINKYSFFCSILVSPFISIKKIAADLYGGCAGAVLKQVFDNEQNSKKISCPTLIIHGMQDTLVPLQHSMALISKCQNYCKLKIVQHMTHTKFNFKNDFIRPLLQFINDIS